MTVTGCGLVGPFPMLSPSSLGRPTSATALAGCFRQTESGEGDGPFFLGVGFDRSFLQPGIGLEPLYPDPLFKRGPIVEASG